MNDTKNADVDRPLCFVIGPIGKSASAERKQADMLLRYVIKPVLEAPEFGYEVRRADEDPRPGMISDRIISDVLNAPLVVADLTGLNPNAFYELGIRHSKLAATIHIASEGTVLPFDNFGHNTIFVDTADADSIDRARDRLTEAARAIRSSGFQVSNPITQARASFAMRESADSRDQLFAKLQERLDTMEGTIAELASSQWARDVSALLEIDRSKYLRVPGSAEEAPSDASRETKKLEIAYWRFRGDGPHTDEAIRLLSDYAAHHRLPVRTIANVTDHMLVYYRDGSTGTIFKGPRRLGAA